MSAATNSPPTEVGLISVAFSGVIGIYSIISFIRTIMIFIKTIGEYDNALSAKIALILKIVMFFSGGMSGYQRY